MLALADQAGVAASRRHFGPFTQTWTMTLRLRSRSPPGWVNQDKRTKLASEHLRREMRAFDRADFVALETSYVAGYSFETFWARFERCSRTLERTVRVVSSRGSG